jgi:valyl-tRNA synthetase
VALVAHPDDERYKPLFETHVTTPLFGARVPVKAHPLADPQKGSGIAMICTFGDTTDVVWWRELKLPVRAIVQPNGTLGPVRWGQVGWESVDEAKAQAAYDQLAGLSAKKAQAKIVELLRESGDLQGDPKPITHAVKFYEKGDRPLEIITSRQWFIKTIAYRDDFIRRGREIRWHPEYMRIRFENWVEGLNGDWCISRQRFFGVPFPVWYRINSDGTTDYAHPLLADESRLPIDPSTDVPDGYTSDQRGKPGGFVGDPDIMDTWATSSVTPADIPDGLAPASTRHHPHVAVLVSGARAFRGQHHPLDQRGDLRLCRRSRPQEDVEVEGQRRDAAGAAEGIRFRRRPLLGRARGPRRGHRLRRRPDEDRSQAGDEDPHRLEVRADRRTHRRAGDRTARPRHVAEPRGARR